MAAVALLCLVVGGCDGCGGPAATGALAASGSATASSSPPVTATIKLVIDGSERDIELGADAQLLTSIIGDAGPAVSSWKLLKAETADQRRIRLVDYGERYENFEVRLDVDEAGKPRFGVYRKPKEGGPSHASRALAKPRHALEGVVKVSVFTVMPKETAPEIMVMVGAEKKPIAHKQIQQLPKTRLSSKKKGDGRKRAGWHLRDVVKLAAPDAMVVKVTLSDEAGNKHVFSDHQLQGDALFPLLRLNRQNELGLTIFKGSDDESPRRIRKIVEIRIDTN